MSFIAIYIRYFYFEQRPAVLILTFLVFDLSTSVPSIFGLTPPTDRVSGLRSGQVVIDQHFEPIQKFKKPWSQKSGHFTLRVRDDSPTDTLKVYQPTLGTGRLPTDRDPLSTSTGGSPHASHLGTVSPTPRLVQWSEGAFHLYTPNPFNQFPFLKSNTLSKFPLNLRCTKRKLIT